MAQHPSPTVETAKSDSIPLSNPGVDGQRDLGRPPRRHRHAFRPAGCDRIHWAGHQLIVARGDLDFEQARAVGGDTVERACRYRLGGRRPGGKHVNGRLHRPRRAILTGALDRTNRSGHDISLHGPIRVLRAATVVGAVAALAAFPGANGQIAFAGARPNESQQVYTIQPDGSGLKQIGPPISFRPAWSPDGGSLVFGHFRPGENIDIFVMNANGGDIRFVSDARQFNGNVDPSFSPNGLRIAYSTGAIRTVGVDGRRPRVVARAVIGRQYALFDPEYSPDGNRIMFAGTPRRRKGGLWTVRPDGSHLRMLREVAHGGVQASYSPDGEHIAITQHGDMFVTREDGSHARRLAGDRKLTSPAWAPAGNRIAAIQSGGPPSCADIVTIDPNGSDLRTLTNNCAVSAAGGSAVYPTRPNWQPLPATDPSFSSRP